MHWRSLSGFEKVAVVLIIVWLLAALLIAGYSNNPILIINLPFLVLLFSVPALTLIAWVLRKFGR